MQLQEKSTWAAEVHGLWMGWVCSVPGHPRAVSTLPIFFYKSFQESLHKSRYWVVWVLESNGELITSLLWFPVLADNVFVAGVIFSQQGYPQANSENCLYKRDTDELPFLQSLNKTVVSQNHLSGGLFYQNRLSQHVRIHQIRKAENRAMNQASTHQNWHLLSCAIEDHEKSHSSFVSLVHHQFIGPACPTVDR